ncbi:histidine phosphatase family protein [Candidatus Woesearchaeota archaeon]|jgi:broad specificity phosphatase PhoE|nr:histidine phosphatase family protein [Candidatus Woesearchaeota archaeon]
MKLILTRHGQTIGNVTGILQGHNPGKLTEKGIQQAKKLALRLKNEKIDAIYSSDLKRASDTAKMIIEFHKNIPVYYVKELREGDCGSFTGKKESEIDWNCKPDDAESVDEMQSRVNKLFESVYKKHVNDTILFVGHNGINKSLMTIINNLPANDLPKIPSFSPTSLTIFEINEDKNNKILLLNCVEHLN